MSPRNSVGLFDSSGSFATFAAIRRASSLLSSLAADRRPIAACRPRFSRERSRLERQGTLARLGTVLYWAATAIAIALIVFAVFAYFTATGSGALAGALFIVALAGLVWLIGRAILYVLAGR